LTSIFLSKFLIIQLGTISVRKEYNSYLEGIFQI
jgi:hypothetical protein